MVYLLGRFFRITAHGKICTAAVVDGEWEIGLTNSIIKFFYLFLFDRLICTSYTVSKNLGWLSKFMAEKIIVAYSGVDVPKKNEIAFNTAKPAGSIIEFGCIGTLRKSIKGQDLVIRAVEHIVKTNGAVPIKIRFFGDGPDRSILEKMIQFSKLENYFEFEGYVKDINQIYSRIDACIVASRTEAGPIVIMESLVRNIPVVAADLDACKEMISNFYEGLLFEQGNHEDLANKLESLIKGNLIEKIRKCIMNADKLIFTKSYQIKRVYRFLSI